MKVANFQSKKKKNLFNIFIFYEYEYSDDIFVIIMKHKIIIFSDVMSVSENSYFFLIENNDQTYVQLFLLTKNSFHFFFFEENYCIVPSSHREVGPTHYWAHISLREREHTSRICNNNPFMYATNIGKYGKLNCLYI